MTDNWQELTNHEANCGIDIHGGTMTCFMVWVSGANIKFVSSFIIWVVSVQLHQSQCTWKLAEWHVYSTIFRCSPQNEASLFLKKENNV